MNDESWAAMNKERKEREQQMTTEQTDLDELMRLHADVSRAPWPAREKRAQFADAAHDAMPRLVAELRDVPALVDEIKNLRSHARDLYTERDALKAELAATDERVREQRRLRCEADAELKAYNELLKDSGYIHELSESHKRAASVTSFAETKAKYERLTEERDALKAELSEAYSGWDDMRSDYDELKGENTRLETRARELAAAYNKLASQYERLENAARARVNKYETESGSNPADEALRAALAPESEDCQTPKVETAFGLDTWDIRRPEEPRATIQSVLEQHGVELTVPPQPPVKDGHTVMAPMAALAKLAEAEHNIAQRLALMAAVEVDKDREHCEQVARDFTESWSVEECTDELVSLLIHEREAAAAVVKARVLEAIEKYDGSKCSGVYDAVEALK